jgi:peptidoglycan hydrolase-like protein with peptidoglycan-binding domain
MTTDPANPNPSRVPDNLWWLWRRLRELEPTSQLGGIYADKSGYHNTRDRNRQKWPGNYSIREAEDQGGPSDKAAALDWTFPNAQRGDYSTIAKYTKRLLASGKDRNDPRLDGLREFYGQSDADRAVEGWDCRHLVAVTSDPTHLWHLHFSFDRNKVASVEGRKVMENLLSVLAGESLTSWQQRNGATPVPPAPPTSTTHRPGSRVLKLTSPQMTGDDVRFVQKWIGPERAGVADGIYGPGTVAGVKWYQRLRGIGDDGEVGSRTWAQMGIRMGS